MRQGNTRSGPFLPSISMVYRQGRGRLRRVLFVAGLLHQPNGPLQHLLRPRLLSLHLSSLRLLRPRLLRPRLLRPRQSSPRRPLRMVALPVRSLLPLAASN